MVKKFIPLLIAGMIGGLSMWAIINWSADNDSSSDHGISLVSHNNYQPSNTNAPFDFSLAAEKASPSVVLIQAKVSEQLANQNRQENPFGRFFDFFGEDGSDFMMPFNWNMPPPAGTGSGVIISNDGYIVTNNHVIEQFDVINVTLYDGSKHEASVVGRDPSTDLALIKIEGEGYPKIEVADSDDAKIGEWVLAIGNPYDELRSTVTAGIISAKGRDLNIIKKDKKIEAFIQTDAAINPGNSGGALVNTDGKLIGINTAIYSRTGSYVGYSFAIPVNLMQDIVEDILETGNIERATLGVSVTELNEEIAEQFNIKLSEGLLVRNVVDRSSAHYAGLLPDDIILEVDDLKMHSFDNLKEIMDFAKVGDELNFKIWRNGELKTLLVRLKDRL